jgi:hypothetical protein
MSRNLNKIIRSWFRLLNCMFTCVCVGTLSMPPQEATPLTSGIYWYYVGTVQATNLFRAVFVRVTAKHQDFPPPLFLVLFSDLQATIYSICSHHNLPSVFFPIILIGFSHAQDSRSDPHVSRPFLDFPSFAKPSQTSCFFKRGLKPWTQEWPTWIPPLWLAALYIRGAAITMSPRTAGR